MRGLITRVSTNGGSSREASFLMPCLRLRALAWAVMTAFAEIGDGACSDAPSERAAAVPTFIPLLMELLQS